MRKTKSNITKALAVLLSLAMLLTGLPAPIYAESIATPTDAVVEVADEAPVEEETVTQEELPSEAELSQPDEPAEIPLPEPEQPDELDQPSEKVPAEPVDTPVEDESEPVSDETPEDSTEDSFPENPPADDVPVGDDPTADGDPTEQPEETGDPTVDRPVTDDQQDAEIPTEPEPETPEPSEQPVEDEPQEEILVEEPEEEPAVYVHPVQAAVDANGYAYLLTQHMVEVYSAPDMQEHIFTIAPDGILLVTAFIEQGGITILEVQYLTDEGEAQIAYAYAYDLPETLLTSEDIDAAMHLTHYTLTAVGNGETAVFAVAGESPDSEAEEAPPVVEQQPAEIPAQPDLPVEQSTEELEQPESSETTEPPAEIPADEIITEDIPLEEKLPIEDEPIAAEGDFVSVTTDTQVFLGVDESAADDYMGDLSIGVFVSDAIVQVEAIEQDSLGRYWYKVCYMYGDTYADGTLKWTEYDSAFVLASETFPTDKQDFTVTDYAFETVPRSMKRRNARASYMPGFNLRDISMSLGHFYVGQTGLYGDSGKDSDYLQIATLPGYGKIYATPHYLDGYTVYCLEHLLPGPGERISGGGYQPTGPYMIVDIDSYMNTPGYSSTIYGEDTMHAIAWVLRHTVPFMELDRSDGDNRTWSRVAGQFAIREVVKQLEGSWHVRDYWQVEDFYAASGNAPGVYLEYARWLAENGIARANMTGSISVSNKSVRTENGMTIGTVTLTTDADLIRISKSYGTVTGHTYGEDGSYYYLNSGDAITITSVASTFSFRAESMSSPDEEANFLVGVSNEAIQKVLIPQTGTPYALDAVTVSCDIPLGSVTVTKTDAATGTVLAGATFDLILGNTVLQTLTTGADGTVTFANVQPGTYTIRERSAPEGYVLGSVNIQTVNVSNGQTSRATFANEKISSRIKIVKTDSLTGDKLAGAAFTITRLSGPAVVGGLAVGESITITTDANGEAQTGWLEWGRYRITETAAPDGYVQPTFSTEIEAYENGKTHSFKVENEPMTGFVQLTKTDSLDDHSIAGVQFDIYHNDQYGSDLAGSMTTNQNGVAISPPLRKGSYLVVEHQNPTGYVHDLVELTAVVRSDETTYLSATNQPIQGTLRIVKQDELTGEALAGAEFTITRISGLPSHNGDGNGEVVAVITTDASGVAVSLLLTYGTYKVEETKVPAHFVDNDFSTEVTISEDNLKTCEIVVQNEPTKGWIRLTKTDQLNGNPIAGIVFDVYYNDQYGEGLAATIVTDENGVAVSEPLRKGRYIVQERGTTVGYVFEEVTLDATVHSDEITELTATNQPVQVKLKLYKRDADEYTGNPADAPAVYGDGVLTGAEFQVLAAKNITDRQGNVIYAKGDVVVASVTTADADASVTTDALWPGLYEVIELTPPIGYQPADGSILVDARDATQQFEAAIITYEGVITNEITYGAQAIVKILGDGTAEADPTRVETPEPDAEFRIYLKKAGFYENAREFERDYLNTDQNGYAMTKPLPFGIYVLEQVKGKAGYEIKGPITFEIDGTENLVNPPPLTLSDQPILYRLKFIKTDIETGKVITLSNATFRLKDANGEYVKQTVFYPREQEIDTFTTDETGSVTLPETVTWGLYFIEEMKAPEGYLIRSEDFSVFVGSEGDKPGQTYELEIEIPNDPVKGCVLLDKKGLQLTGFTVSTDTWGNEVHTPVYEEGNLAGAVFELRATEDVTDMDGTVWYQAGDLADTITTTEQGGDASKELPLGKYNLIEVSAPEGYFFTSHPIAVDLLYKDDQTALVEVQTAVANDFLPAEITLWKEKEEIRVTSSGENGVQSILMNEPGEGFVFGLFNTNDLPYADGTLMADTLVATGATDENGMLVFSGTFPHGDYYIRELAAPDGWKISADAIGISLSSNDKMDDENILHILLMDVIYNELIHGKVTLAKTDITGEKTLPGATIEVYDEEGTVIYREVTDENGEIPNIPVRPGKYTFREIYAPDGYSLNEATMIFTVDADGVVTGETTIRDDYTRFTIEKQDETGKPLAGVEFSLIAANGSVAQTVNTDRYGVATFEKIPFGTYRVKETRPLAGYFAAEMDVEVTVDKTFINPVEPLAVIENRPNEVVIQKVDQDGKPLTGAEFALMDAYGERFAVATSDANGMVRFTKVPYGSYTIRELKAPDGYLISKQEIPITIDADYRSSEKPLATVVNHLKRVQFIKVDTSGKFLPGVEFTLINAVTHEVVETVTSNEKGEFIFTKFDYGDWIVRETEAPEGYSRMEDYLLHVDEEWEEPKPITLVNYPDTYAFVKFDNKKNTLAGAVFAVEDESGNVVQEVVSGENGVVYIDGLLPGRYIIREIEAPEGFTCSDDTLEVVIDEDYTHPAKLKRFVNYPSISTGVDITPTALTWIGLGLAGVAGIILVIGMKGNRKSSDKKWR